MKHNKHKTSFGITVKVNGSPTLISGQTYTMRELKEMLLLLNFMEELSLVSPTFVSPLWFVESRSVKQRLKGFTSVIPSTMAEYLSAFISVFDKNGDDVQYICYGDSKGKNFSLSSLTLVGTEDMEG